MPLSLPRVINPFDWSVDRAPTRFKVEGQDLYRQLGVSPDTDFDGIKAAVEALKVKYESDPKRCIKLEVVQDKIMELRLRQASGGRLAMSGEILAKNTMNRARDDRNAEDANKFKAPKWTKGLVKPVTKNQALAYAKWIGGMFFIGGVVAPGFAGVMGFIVMMTGMNNIYARGRPKKFVEEGMPPKQDLPNSPEFFKMAGITGSFALLSIVLSIAVITPVLVPTYMADKFAKERILLACFSVSSMVQSCMFYIYPPKKKGKKTF